MGTALKNSLFVRRKYDNKCRKKEITKKGITRKIAGRKKVAEDRKEGR
jgi:hypothetical protein